MQLKINILTIILFVFASINAQRSTISPEDLNKQLPPGALNEEYFKGGLEETKRLDNLALERLAPNKELKEKYASFLSTKNTGIVKLWNKKECSLKLSKKFRLEERNEYAKQCPTNYFVGNAQNFSFRKKGYSDENQSDITYNGKFIYCNGLLTLGLMSNLGDVDLNDINIDGKFVTYLHDYVPAKTVEDADKQKLAIENGITQDNQVYTKGFNVFPNNTFILRSIAYRANLASYKNYFGLGITFDPFYNDLRQDVIVAFRIIEINDGGITIIWKELQRKDSPKLKMETKN